MKTVTQIRTLCCPNSTICLVLVCAAFSISSCTETPENRPSPLRSDSTEIAGSFIQIEYSSPRVRNRKIFGIGDDYLEQYGKVWRTGANDATVLSTSADIRLDTFLLPKGKYSLFTIPGPKTWEIIINKEWNLWGSYYRKDSLDFFRIKVPATTYTKNQENMEFNFTNEALNFRWETVGWSLPIN